MCKIDIKRVYELNDEIIDDVALNFKLPDLIINT